MRGTLAGQTGQFSEMYDNAATTSLLAFFLPALSPLPYQASRQSAHPASKFCSHPLLPKLQRLEKQDTAQSGGLISMKI